MRCANAKKAREKKELEDKDKDDLPIIDNAYDLENDEAAETVFRKLIENAKEMDYNKNSHWRYTGNSDLNNINKATGDQQSDSESYSNLELEEKSLKWKQQLQETEKRIQNLLDTMEISKTDKMKYVSVIHYILLLQHDSSKMEATPSQSLLHNEEVSLKVANYLRSTKFKVIPRLVKQYFENNILPELHIDQAQMISLITAWCWIKKIGVYYKRYQKGVYVDGHKRENMVAYHKVFLQNMAEYDRLMPKWTDIDCKVCEEPEFLVKTIGRLKDEEGEARLIMQLGANHDGYWDRQKTHPGYIGVWAFDNATSHKVIASNALVATRMNLKPDFLNERGLIQQEIEKYGHK
ncbi:16726_t:CDS:2 [Gigaspora margarita]|uniref:16726_t:CDS:1 n=1 Tax=Gigaspora margarita TaxID=4874 RepID=A0ABN7VJA7_GIGMA|nr:16726_t:CDS:2 [Gigaspora margarita]